MDNNYNNNFDSSNRSNGMGERKGMAIASVIMGILSLPLAYCTGFLGIILGLMAVLFGIFSKADAPRRSTSAVTGIITGGIGLAFGIVMTVIALVYLKNNFTDIMSQMEGYQNFLSK